MCVVNITLEPSGGDQDMECSVTVVKRSEEFGNLQLKELPLFFFWCQIYHSACLVAHLPNLCWRSY